MKGFVHSGRPTWHRCAAPNTNRAQKFAGTDLGHVGRNSFLLVFSKRDLLTGQLGDSSQTNENSNQQEFLPQSWNTRPSMPVRPGEHKIH